MTCGSPRAWIVLRDRATARVILEQPVLEEDVRAALDTLHQSSPFDRYSPQVYYPAQTSIDAPPEPAALPDAW